MAPRRERHPHLRGRVASIIPNQNQQLLPAWIFCQELFLLVFFPLRLTHPPKKENRSRGRRRGLQLLVWW